MFYFQEKAQRWEGMNKQVWFKQGLEKRRSGCPFKLEWADRNAETRVAMLGLNFWMPEWTINCVFIFCWHVVHRDCPILWMIPCYLYELPPSRYFLFNSICFLYDLCDVSGECLLPFSFLVLSLGVCARASFCYPVLVSFESCELFQWKLMAAFTIVAFVSHPFWCWQGLDKYVH